MSVRETSVRDSMMGVSVRETSVRDSMMGLMSKRDATTLYVSK